MTNVWGKQECLPVVVTASKMKNNEIFRMIVPIMAQKCKIS